MKMITKKNIFDYTMTESIFEYSMLDLKLIELAVKIASAKEAKYIQESLDWLHSDDNKLEIYDFMKQFNSTAELAASLAAVVDKIFCDEFFKAISDVNQNLAETLKKEIAG